MLFCSRTAAVAPRRCPSEGVAGRLQYCFEPHFSVGTTLGIPTDLGSDTPRCGRGPIETDVNFDARIPIMPAHRKPGVRLLQLSNMQSGVDSLTRGGPAPAANDMCRS